MGSTYSTAAMPVATSEINRVQLNLQTLLHHSYELDYNMSDFCYFLQVKPHMTWKQFIELMGPEAQDWVNCSQCAKTWKLVSTLSNTKGQPVIFRDSLVVYPEFAVPAITAFKASFRSTDYTDKVVYLPRHNGKSDCVMFGHEESGGHVHLFLHANLPSLGSNCSSTDEEDDDVERVLQQIVRVGLRQLELTANHPKCKWSPEFFKKAAQSNYGCFTPVIRDFCNSMISGMEIVKDHPRMLRALLIEQILIFCEEFKQMHDVEDLMQVIIQIIKIFRRRAAIEFTPRETIFRNFILNSKAEKNTYDWPTKSTYAERIVAISLHNALYTDKDTNISCLMLGIPYNHEAPAQLRRHALGKALRAYLSGGPIYLGTNQHRLQVLYYNMIGSWISMPGLSTVESCSILFVDGSNLELAGETLAGFLDTPIGNNQIETLFNALVSFTSCPPKAEIKG